MYYGKKKGIIILIIIIILVLLLGVTGFAYAFLATDLFRSNDELFFKYLGKSVEQLELGENEQLEAISKLKQQMPYTVEGELKANVETEETNNPYKKLNNAKIEYTGKVDNINEKVNYTANLIYNNNNVISVEYAKNEDIYALKCLDIVTTYIGFQNSNLKQFATKLGLANEQTSELIPDEVQFNNINGIYKFSESDKKYLVETYLEVIRNNIPASSFTKESNIATIRNGVTYNTTGYRLNLNDTQMKKVLVAILQTAKQDSITLNLISNKAKILGLGSEYTEINKLTSTIDEYISKIQNSTNVMNDISIIFYVDNGSVITTEIIEKNSAKYTIYAYKNGTSITRNLLVENFKSDVEIGTVKVNMLESKTATSSYYNLTMELDDKYIVTANLKNEGSASQNSLNTNLDISLTDEKGNTYSIEGTQKMNFVNEITNMFEVSRNNCAVLNDYSAEQVSGLLTNIVARVQYVYDEKTKTIGVGTNSNSITNSIDDLEKKTFNEKFSSYTGKVSGTSLKTLYTIVKKNNDESTRKVTFVLDDVNVMGDDKSINTSKTYNVEMKYDESGFINEIKAVDSEKSQTAGENSSTNTINQ